MQAESEATGVWCTFICMCESGASLLCDAYARLLGSLQKPTTLFKLNAAFEDLFYALHFLYTRSRTRLSFFVWNN